MAIRVQGPNGEIVEFPDGMSNDAIVGVMRQHFGGPQTPSQPQVPQKSVGRDVAEQVPFGMARGFDASLNFGPRVAELVKKYVPDEVLASQPVLSAMVAGNALRKELANEAGADAVASNNISAARRLIPENNEPQTTAGRYAGAVGEMAGGALLPVAGSAQRLVPAAKNLLYSSLGSGVAGQTAKEADAPLWAQIAASVGGGLAAPNLANAAFGRGPVDPRLLAKTEAAQAAQQEGIAVPRAAVADTIGKGTAGRLASFPIVGAPLQNASRASLDKIEARANEIADAYGVGTRATAGGALGDSITDYITQGSKLPVSRMYDAVDNLINPTVTTPLNKTAAAVADLQNAPSLAQRALNQKAIATIEDDLAKGALTYPEIKSLRTVVGGQTKGLLTTEQASLEPAYKQLYGALSEDLRSAIGNAGGPKALATWERANSINQVAAQRRDQLAKIVGLKGDAGDELVFDRLLTLASDKGGANINRLIQARKSVSPDAWDNFTSAFIRRMGENPRTGEWEPGLFLKAYNEKLSPQGQQLIFNSTNKPELARSIDNLAKVSKQFSEFYKMGNPSGTAGATWLAGLFGGAYGVGGLPTAIPGAGTMWLMSKWFASPANVDKMTRTLQARMAATRNPNPTNIERASQMTSALANELSALNDQR